MSRQFTQEELAEIEGSGTPTEKLLLANLKATHDDREQNQAQQRKIETNKYNIDGKKLNRAVGAQSFGLVGTFTQATLAVVPKSAQAQLQSSVAVIQMGKAAIGLGVSLMETFENARAKAAFAEQAPDATAGSTTSAPAAAPNNPMA